MDRVGRGDEAAFRILAGRHIDRALRLARRITGNASEAEDIVQEALLRTWVNAPRWRPTATVRTWLYRVVFNLCLNERRRPALVALDAVGEPPHPGADPAATMEAHESDASIARAIATLPERQRAALALTYYEGLSNAEASEILGTSVSGVEALLVRARRRLRRNLGDERE